MLQEPFEGFFQTDRYIVEGDDGEQVPVAQMHVKSLISWPESGHAAADAVACDKRNGMVGIRAHS